MIQSKNQSIRRALFVLLSCMLLALTGSIQVSAQTKSEVLSFKDIQQWRTHSVSLSDNGQWFTTLYSLRDKSDKETDTISEQKMATYFNDSNKTDVLYVHNAEEGLKYQIPKASQPLFSSSSEWIAYRIKLEKNNKDEKGKKDEEKTIIELKHLESGYTVSYESKASFQFWEDEDYFVTSDKTTLLIYDLKNRNEFFIGNIGEYLLDDDSEYIVYTINSDDKRGNGIYMYHPKSRTSKAVETGNELYSNLSWNHDRTSIAAYKYKLLDGEIDHKTIKVVLCSALDSESVRSEEYPVNSMKGLRDLMGPATKSDGRSNQISWSKDNERLFIKLKQYDVKEEQKNQKKKNKKEESTVQVWLWKDKKLLSERIMDYDTEKKKAYDAIFFTKENRVKPITGDSIQRLIQSKGTDNWAIGMDESAYISDWDISKYDLYAIDLKTGEKKLIQEEVSSRYGSGVHISPDGETMIYWDGAHYWSYNFSKASKTNISEKVEVSFVNKEYDRFGYIPDYGFAGWVKNEDAVLVYHKHHIWKLPLTKKSQATNLTIASGDSIRFRLEDNTAVRSKKVSERYIDLSKGVYLYAFNTRDKYAGFFSLKGNQLKELIYEPAYFYSPWPGYELLKAKSSDQIIYIKGDYQNFSEAYLTTSKFTKATKITNTNPQQQRFKWGKRILIDYTNDDGVPLQGILSIPDSYKKGDKLPMIVYSYEKLSYRMYQYPAPYLSGASVPEMLYVSDGYLFLQPDIHFNVGTPHSDMHECIDAAISKVIDLGYVDESKIGYEGFSFGGHCGMYISTQENKFAAIAAGAGVSNLVQGFNIDIVRDGSNEQDYYMTGQGRLAADPTSNLDMYVSESPVFNAQSMNTPLLLFHGTDDKVVQWEHSFGFYSILRYLKKPVVFLSYRGEGHGLRKEANRIDIQTRLKEFFDHHLKDGESKKWMTEELPYKPEKVTNDKTKAKPKLPKWK